MQELANTAKQRYVSPALPATVYLGLGEKAKALDWMEKAFEDRDPSMLILRRFQNQNLKLPSTASSPIDRQLVVGAAIFGVGWGFGGFCPGPALANLGALRIEALLFVPAMAIGMFLAQRFFGADQ